MSRLPFFLFGLALAARAPAIELRLIGETSLPSATRVENTIVGGLSGLDYDPASDRWLAVSDDKAEHGPARCYVVRLDYDEHAFRGAEVTGLIALRQPSGADYPSSLRWRADAGPVPDFEAVRIDPADGSLWYASEGDPWHGFDPFVRHAARNGDYIGELPLPPLFRFAQTPADHGPRFNLTIESITWNPAADTLWVGLEAPLQQDGPVASATAGALTRVTEFTRDGRMLGQHAYRLDPWQLPPSPGRRADNGVSEMLTLPDGQLLVLERSGAENTKGEWHFGARIYAADFRQAADVSAVESFARATVTPAPKRLLFDFAQAGRPRVDNIEGLAWGRRLANGHASLVAVSDDNFLPVQETQFWVFELLPDPPSAAWDVIFDGVVHSPKKIGGFVGAYRWLSNFHPCRVAWEGRVYGSAEAAYQSAKFPPAERDGFTTLTPDAAKQRAHARPIADPAGWEARKEHVMREVVWAKFSQNATLAARLRATGERQLEETNTWGDREWGVYQGTGDNRLGRVLMDTRTKLDGAR